MAIYKFLGLVLAFGLGGVAPVAWGSTVTLNVATTADGTGTSPLTLRQAINEASAGAASAGGGNTYFINVPPGTYPLTSGALILGTALGAGEVYLVGAGASSTIVTQTLAGASSDHVFNIDSTLAGGWKVAFSGLTITGGSDTQDGVGGGGIVSGAGGSGPADPLFLTNCIIANNFAVGANGQMGGFGGGIASYGGSCTIVGCTFSHNVLTQYANQGGGLYYLQLEASDRLLVLNSAFLQNSITIPSQISTSFLPTGAQGGAIFLDDMPQGIEVPGNAYITNCVFGGNTVTTTGTTTNQTFGGGAISTISGIATYISGCTFTNNSAKGNGTGGAAGTGGNGGAILVQQNGTNFINYCRFIGNTADAGGGSDIWGYHTAAGGTCVVSANDNWWGSESGPGSGHVQNASTLNNWLYFTNTANAATDMIGVTDTLTASFLKDSAGNAVSAGNLTALTNLSVVWSAADGSISSAQTVIQTAGAATATFAGTTAGSGSGSATVDGVTSSAHVSVTPGQASVGLSGLSQTYDGAAIKVAATTVPGGLNVILTYAGSPEAPTNAGSYTVIGTVNDANYSGSVTNTLVVSNATLIATADNQFRYVTQPNPVLTGTLVGAVPSDDLSLSFTTAATPASPPGSYDIVPRINDPDNRLGNYKVTITNGTLAVVLGQPAITLVTNRLFYTLKQPPVLLAPNAVFTAPSSPDFTGGHLTVQIITNANPLDLLFIQNGGANPGQIGVDTNAGSVSFGGTPMAAYTGGTANDASLEFTFNANANLDSIQALLGSLTFSIENARATNPPVDLARTLVFTLDDGNSLTSAPVLLNLVINHQPLSAPYHIATGTNLPVTITFSRLLANGFDPDGDQISLAQVAPDSLFGGVLSTNSLSLTYTPATNFTGRDQFTYVVSDGRTGTNTGLVYVQVLTGNNLAMEDALGSPVFPGPVATLGVSGVSLQTYRLQASQDLILWQSIGNVLIPNTGFTNFFDPDFTNYPHRFYRTVYP